MLFPCFVSHALGVLPEFLEAIGHEMRDVQGLAFRPNAGEHDADTGKVIFFFHLPVDGPEHKVVLIYRYVPGEEGTRGSLSGLEYILFHNRAGVKFRFSTDHSYYKNTCFRCHGGKYRFVPAGADADTFFALSERERLNRIESYLNTK